MTTWLNLINLLLVSSDCVLTHKIKWASVLCRWFNRIFMNIKKKPAEIFAQFHRTSFNSSSEFRFELPDFKALQSKTTSTRIWLPTRENNRTKRCCIVITGNYYHIRSVLFSTTLESVCFIHVLTLVREVYSGGCVAYLLKLFISGRRCKKNTNTSFGMRKLFFPIRDFGEFEANSLSTHFHLNEKMILFTFRWNLFLFSSKYDHFFRLFFSFDLWVECDSNVVDELRFLQ